MKDFTSIKTNIPVLGNNVIPTLWNVYQEKNPTTIPTKEKSCKNLKIYSKFLFYHSFKTKKTHIPTVTGYLQGNPRCGNKPARNWHTLRTDKSKSWLWNCMIKFMDADTFFVVVRATFSSCCLSHPSYLFTLTPESWAVYCACKTSGFIVTL